MSASNFNVPAGFSPLARKERALVLYLLSERCLEAGAAIQNRRLGAEDLAAFDLSAERARLEGSESLPLEGLSAGQILEAALALLAASRQLALGQLLDALRVKVAPHLFGLLHAWAVENVGLASQEGSPEDVVRYLAEAAVQRAYEDKGRALEAEKVLGAKGAERAAAELHEFHVNESRRRGLGSFRFLEGSDCPNGFRNFLAEAAKRQRGVYLPHFPQLMSLLGGNMAAGNTHIVQARPGVGKTFLVSNWELDHILPRYYSRRAYTPSYSRTFCLCSELTPDAKIKRLVGVLSGSSHWFPMERAAAYEFEADYKERTQTDFENREVEREGLSHREQRARAWASEEDRKRYEAAIEDEGRKRTPAMLRRAANLLRGSPTAKKQEEAYEWIRERISSGALFIACGVGHVSSPTQHQDLVATLATVAQLARSGERVRAGGTLSECLGKYHQGMAEMPDDESVSILVTVDMVTDYLSEEGSQSEYEEYKKLVGLITERLSALAANVAFLAVFPFNKEGIKVDAAHAHEGKGAAERPSLMTAGKGPSDVHSRALSVMTIVVDPDPYVGLQYSARPYLIPVGLVAQWEDKQANATLYARIGNERRQSMARQALRLAGQRPYEIKVDKSRFGEEGVVRLSRRTHSGESVEVLPVLEEEGASWRLPPSHDAKHAWRAVLRRRRLAAERWKEVYAEEKACEPSLEQARDWSETSLNLNLVVDARERLIRALVLSNREAKRWFNSHGAEGSPGHESEGSSYEPSWEEEEVQVPDEEREKAKQKAEDEAKAAKAREEKLARESAKKDEEIQKRDAIIKEYKKRERKASKAPAPKAKAKRASKVEG